MVKVLALTIEGDMTYCTAPPELRGKGRCNHIAHQEEGQTIQEFLMCIEDKIRIEDDKIVDNTHLVNSIIQEYAKKEDPNWEDVIFSIQNPFAIGKTEDGSYEEAELLDVSQEYKNNGAAIKLTAHYLFRGREFECSFGEVPSINEDGSIYLDGVNWRVLPVVSQTKCGVISYRDNIVIKQHDGRNISIVMSKDPDCDTCKIYGKDVPLDVVENYLKTGSIVGLTSGQIYALKDIEPIAFERFPDFDLRKMKELPPDEAGDLAWRKCFRFEDIVKEQMRVQARRMGVTFRTNLSKRQNVDSENPMDESLDEKYPLFYQVNLTENIKKDLVSRSNVQFADNLNPISALSQNQRISFTGPGGYNKDSAPYEVRMPHKTHEHTLDVMDISSGKNVGLTTTLSKGYIDERGFIQEKKPGIHKVLNPSDFIPFKNHDDPDRGIMAVAHMKQACPIIGGEDPLPLGHAVSDNAWSKIKGAKLGCELLTAYIPDRKGYEDAVWLSASAADKMSTIQNSEYKTSLKPEGLKIGQRVERKQVYNGQEIKTGGVITNLRDDGFTVETVYKMEVGDKIAGRHGNKSVVSKILLDNDMPKVLNEHTGRLESSQIVMSPNSVSGRKNLGQVMECNQAMGDGPVIEKKRKVLLADGKQIEASAGKQFIMRLNHIAEKKISSYSDDMTAKKEASGARLGEMESILLSTDEDRIKVLDYLRHQESYDSHNKLNSLFKAIGVDMSGVNWK